MVTIPSGLDLDRPALGATPYWRSGYNIRSNEGRVETIGLFAPMKTVAGVQIDLPGTDVYRSVMIAPGVLQGEIIMASANYVMAMIYDPTSSIATGTRYAVHAITPAGLPAVADVVAVPSSGRVDIPPVWWWAESTDYIIGGRANVDEPAYVWDRVGANQMTAIANCPHGAVGGCVVGSILVLLGAESITDPDPARQMTIRWSDRFNFTNWTPSDITVSGEMQLEGGSRIVGGGAISQGIMAWTDKRMALLTETGDPDSVFARRYIDGGRGLMCNKAWVEADGVLWWWDETRTLNYWAGGQPAQVVCPIRAGTILRMSDSDLTRAYLVANPEYGEVILWYPDPPLTPGTEPVMWTGLVYSYLDKEWSIWRLDRPAWGQRVGVTRNIGIDRTGKVWQHDLDAPIPDAWLPSPSPSGAAPLTSIQPFDWSLTTNMIIPDGPLDKAHHLTQLMVDNIPSPSSTGAADVIEVTVTGYGELRRDPSVAYTETQSIAQNASRAQFRVEGKAIEITIGGEGCTTLWRLGEIEVVLPITASR